MEQCLPRDGSLETRPTHPRPLWSRINIKLCKYLSLFSRKYSPEKTFLMVRTHISLCVGGCKIVQFPLYTAAGDFPLNQLRQHNAGVLSREWIKKETHILLLRDSRSEVTGKKYIQFRTERKWL